MARRRRSNDAALLFLLLCCGGIVPRLGCGAGNTATPAPGGSNDPMPIYSSSPSTSAYVPESYGPAIEEVRPKKQQEERKVVITEYGKRYHSPGCGYGRTGWEVPISEAIEGGYTPCQRCGG